jgi:hypothetical protein
VISLVAIAQEKRARVQLSRVRIDRRWEKDSWDVPADRKPPPLRVHRGCPGCGGTPGGVTALPSFCRVCANRVLQFGTTERAEDLSLDAARRKARRARAAAAVPPERPEVRR